MPISWEQEFEFFLAAQDGVPMSVFIDMNAVDHAPLTTHPYALAISVALKNPDENGLRRTEELPAMSTLEDELAETLKREADAIYWGRHIVSGHQIFFYYLPQAPEEGTAPAFVPSVRSLLRDIDYSAEMSAHADPEWEAYRDSYPTSYHRQKIANRHLQEQLENQGDRLRKRRMIDHTALFPTRTAAEEAAQALRKRRFSTDRLHDQDESGAHELHFHRKDSCHESRPDAITDEILDCIEPRGGTYDGWGCAVTR